MGASAEIHLRRRPSGALRRDDLRIVAAPVPEARRAGELTIENSYLSIDASTRVRMSAREGGAMARVRLDRPLSGFALGHVIESRRTGFARGDLVMHSGGWRTHALIGSGDIGWRGPHRIACAVGLAEQHYLSALGPTGLTAYTGIRTLGNVRPGDTVLVSGAAGGVGALAVQLAKMSGARVLGTAGSAEKLAFLEELGVDVAINYRSAGFVDELTSATPHGIDLFLDCVGGMQLQLGLELMNRGGRVILCGAIAGYDRPTRGPENLFLIIERELSVRGFLTRSFAHRLAGVRAELEQELKAGHLRDRITIVDGLEGAISGFVEMFSTGHAGKLLAALGPRAGHGGGQR